MIIETKCMINVMGLNHPQTIPQPWSVQKCFSTILVPVCQKGWGVLI